MDAFPPKRLVVIIEPSLTLRVLLTLQMARCGYASIGYASPGPALADLRQHLLTVPVLVLLSERQTHPGPTAWNALHLLQQWALPLQIIVLLENERVLSAIEAQLAGACATLAKPFRVQQLLSLIERYGSV